MILDEVCTFPHQEHAYIETEGGAGDPRTRRRRDALRQQPKAFHQPRYDRGGARPTRRTRARDPSPPVGGAFGGKDDTLYQMTAQAAKLALLTGKPVRLVFSRAESMAASYKRQAAQIHLTLGAEANGVLQAANVEVLMDSGAYASMTSSASWRATVHAAGAYRYRAVRVIPPPSTPTTAFPARSGDSATCRPAPPWKWQSTS